ncbi:hypothetical protein CANARDRAFT_203663 [[Candida] arabinofermentans NRRL YB-2248]|uniref:Uncharacterized protein n=1 Tax=[Candida] arabinofermentans NRRL YB-2248 TaxID=983967 RepID=A0A1E4SUN7_9ASCO|nr:hypothetical protein CANARDRAFT_203663 [[Candida] arabinofermentans NRRL YB-2248]
MNEDDEDEDDGFDENGNIELDLSNNSQGYFDNHKDSIFTVSTHPKLPLAVTGGGDNTAFIWTTHTNPTKLVSELKGHTESVISSGFTSDGEYVITGDMTGKVLVHKATKKYQVWVKHGELDEIEEVLWIKIHPKQNVFAVGALDGSIWVYQIEPTLELIFSGFSHSMECTNGLFINVDSLDELKLITVSEDGSIIGWNCFTSQQDFKIEGTNQLKGLLTPWVSISSDSNSKIVAIGSRDSQIVILNSETGTVLTMFKALELTEDQDVYDASIESITWCDSLNLMALGLVSGDIFIFDSNTWKVRKTLKISDAVTKLIFLKDSPILIGSSMDGKIYKWDSRTGENLYTFVGHHMGVLDFDIDNTGKKLITAGDEGVSLIFEI